MRGVSSSLQSRRLVDDIQKKISDLENELSKLLYRFVVESEKISLAKLQRYIGIEEPDVHSSLPLLSPQFMETHMQAIMRFAEMTTELNRFLEREPIVFIEEAVDLLEKENIKELYTKIVKNLQHLSDLLVELFEINNESLSYIHQVLYLKVNNISHPTSQEVIDNEQSVLKEESKRKHLEQRNRLKQIRQLIDQERHSLKERQNLLKVHLG